MVQTLTVTALVWLTLALLCLLLLVVLALRLNPLRKSPVAANQRGDDRGRRVLGLAATARRTTNGAPASPPAMQFLIVVSRNHPGLFEELLRVFGGNGNTHMIFDRRTSQRRALRVWTSTERRRVERRQRQIDADLRTTGWALVRRTVY